LLTVEYSNDSKTEFSSRHFLIGCNSSRSFVSEEFNIKLEGLTLPVKAALANFLSYEEIWNPEFDLHIRTA
jgi:hypothetical protein